MKKELFMLIAMMVVVGMPAIADPIAYVEGDDLPTYHGSHTTPFLLEPGDNTVSGSISWLIIFEPYQSVADSDSFRVAVSAGDILTSITIDIENGVTTGDSHFDNVYYDLFDNPPTTPMAPTEDIPVSSTGLSLFSSVMPLGFGIYGIEASGMGAYLEDGVPAVANYTFHLYVEPIPEPTSLLLLGTGLGIMGLAVYRRRKK